MIHYLFNTVNDLFKHFFSIRRITIYDLLLNNIPLLIDNATGNSRSPDINSNSVFHLDSSFHTHYHSLNKPNHTNLRLQFQSKKRRPDRPINWTNKYPLPTVR